MAELAPGSTFAGHRIETVAGRGGMGVVYRATQLALDRTVALKVIAPGLIEDDAMRRRFVRESKVAASIDHPNVIPIYYAGEEDGVAYIAMRYVAGDDLRSLVRREGRLEPRRAARLVAQVGAALDAAHAAGLVHRDVKPANVLLGPDEHVYLTDFGLTKHALSVGGATKPGHWVGTLDYVAPEQIRGDRIDARADVYALGCVLYYALTGHVPFEREGDEGRLWAHLSEDPPKPSARVPKLPAELDDVVASALAKSPDDRFPSAGDLARAAIAAVAGERPRERERLVAVGAAAPADAPTVTAGRLDPTRVLGDDDAAEVETRVQAPPGRRRRAIVAGVVAAALLAGIAVGALAHNGDDQPAPGAGTGTPSATPTATAAASAQMSIAGRVRVGRRPNVIGVNSRNAFVGSFGLTRLGLVNPRTTKRRASRPRVGKGVTAMDVDDHRAWVAVGRSRRLVRLDPATGRPRGSIGTPLAPVALVVTSRSLWVGLITAVPGGPDELAQYDRRSGELMRRIPVPEGIGALAAAPGGAIWIAHRRRALVSRFDTRTLSITRRVRVGADAPFGIAFGAGAVWVSSPRDDLVTRVDPDSGNVTRIGVGRSPQGIAVRGDDVFVANSDDNTVTRIDARTRLAVGSPLQVDLNPYALAVDHGSVWVTCVPDSRVVRIRYQPLTGRGG